MSDARPFCLRRGLVSIAQGANGWTEIVSLLETLAKRPTKPGFPVLESKRVGLRYMMRLTCPNCAAQYEIEDDVIPVGGRDVQCSNCGHTWLQKPNERPTTQPLSSEDMEPVPQAPEDEVAASPEPKRRELDDDVSSVLREEADRERAERVADRASGLEFQTEMGLDNSPEEMAPSLGESAGDLEDGDAIAAAAAAAPKRKDMLPDIEEINSSLSPRDDAAEDDDEPQNDDKARRGGFRRGFLLVVIIFVIMAAVYLFAPNIADMNPQTAGALGAYVEWVDGLSAGLNNAMAGIADRVSNLLSSMNSDGS
jgi:predicted Zn finger-like uncharacterized protein